jgi:outer membrane protein assembly factor BamB
LVVQGVGGKTLVFTVSMDDTVFALDADTGKVVWQKNFPNTLTPPRPATWLCSNSQNATPVIDKQKGIIYFNTSDGKLRGLSLTTGAERLPPTDFVTPFARNWSLNLIDDVIYSTTARGCGEAISNISAMDVSDPMHPRLSRLYTYGGKPAGAWGRGGVVKGPKGILTQTADGLSDPAVGSFGEAVLALAPKDLRITDSFTPTNWAHLNSRDLDMGSTNPVVFPFKGRTIVASIAKESVLYLLDADALGGSNHTTPLYQSPRLGNDEEVFQGRGVWGAISTFEDPQGQRFLYVPMWGPLSKTAPTFKYSYGEAADGSIMAFQVTDEGGKLSLAPVWTSLNMHVPDPPVIANGVVYAIQTGENTTQNQGRAGGPGGAPGARGAGAAPGPPGATGAAGAAGAPPDQAAQGGAAPAGRAGRGAFDPSAASKFRATPASNLVLYALDAQTGKQLYSSEKIIPSWVHFSEPVVAASKVFVVTWDAHVYAFGLKK